MNNFLPAVSLSSFVHLNKEAAPQPKEYLQSENYLYNSKTKYSANVLAKRITQVNLKSAAGIRVVAVTLHNNTPETIIVKKSLRIQEENMPGEIVDFMPSALSKKQAISVYFMYNLLQQRLPQVVSLFSAEKNHLLAISNSEINSKAYRDIFISNTQNLDVMAKLKEANLFYKSISPGQTLTGLLLCLSSSAAPLQFYLA